MMRYDFVDVSRAQITPEGWIKDKPILTRAGIFEYRRADGTIQREYRPPEEVFSPKHLASLRGIPVTDGHPGRVDAENHSANIGTVLSEGERQDENLVAEIVIHAPKKLGPKRELSLGYSLDLDETPGEVDGKRYDAVQRNLVANHLAGVQRGRAGNAKLRLDRFDAADASIPQEEIEEMPDPTLPKLVSVRVDRFDYQAQPEVAAALERANEQIAAEKTRADTAIATEKQRADAMEAERDSLKAQVAAHDAALAKARQDAVTEVKQRLELEATATKHGVEVRQDMEMRGIKEAVVSNLRPNVFKFDGKPDAYVDALFDSEVAHAENVKNIAGNNRSIVNGGAPNNGRADSAAPNVGPVRSSAELRARMSRIGA